MGGNIEDNDSIWWRDEATKNCYHEEWSTNTKQNIHLWRKNVNLYWFSELLEKMNKNLETKIDLFEVEKMKKSNNLNQSKQYKNITKSSNFINN